MKTNSTNINHQPTKHTKSPNNNIKQHELTSTSSSSSSGGEGEDWDTTTPILTENQLDYKIDQIPESDYDTILSHTTNLNLTNQLSDTIIQTTSSIQTSSIQTTSPNSDIPIFFVDGFMSFRLVDIWVNIITHFRQRAYQTGVPCPPLHRLHSGGIASAHDVAVSLFYQIKGGTEDFGAEHSTTHSHDRYGLHHNGLYKLWSSEFPVHLLAHSYGGNVVMHLQMLLDAKFFHDENGVPYDTNAGWILSAAMISSPLRGTSCALILGMIPGDPGKIRAQSIGRILYSLAHVWEWLEWHDPREGWLGINFRISHFGLGRNRSFRNMISKLFGPDVFDRGLDSCAEGFQLEKYLKDPYPTFDTTYYRTYATSMTRTSMTGEEVAIPYHVSALRTTANIMGSFDFKRDGQGYLDPLIPFQPLWRKNDGACPLISQFHPRHCHELNCHHTTLPPPDKPHSTLTTPTLPQHLHPGTWYTTTIPDCSHIDLVPGFDITTTKPNSNPNPDPFQLPRRLLNGLLHPFTPSNLTPSSSPSSHPNVDTDLITTNLRHYRQTFISDYLQFLIKVESSTSTSTHPRNSS